MGDWAWWDSHRYDDAAWRNLSTGVAGVQRGYASIKRDKRGYPLFVAATGLSDASLRSHVEEATEEAFPMSLLSEQDVRAKERVQNAEAESASTSRDRTEESMATLYSRLVASSAVTQSFSQGDATRRDNCSSELRVLPSKPTIRNTSAPDWFIRRAVQRQGHRRTEGESESSLQGKSERSSPVLCVVCDAVVQLGSNPRVIAAHQASIAHQLAVSSLAAPVPTMGSNVSRRHTAESAQPYADSKIVLKRTNVGYMALERMGWRPGMGLGPDEWEVVRVDAIRRSQAGTRQTSECTLPHKISGENKAGSIDLTMEQDTDEEQDADCTSTPSEFEDAIATAAKGPMITNPKRRADILLEPVPLHVRPDRRGIGVRLPTSARVRDRPVPAAGTRMAQSPAHNKREYHRTKKLSRTAQHKRDRAEWLALRASLND